MIELSSPHVTTSSRFSIFDVRHQHGQSTSAALYSAGGQDRWSRPWEESGVGTSDRHVNGVWTFDIDSVRSYSLLQDQLH